MWLLAGFGFLWADGLRPAAWGPPSVPHPVGLCTGQLTIAASQGAEPEEEVTVFCSRILEGTSHTSAVFYLLKLRL